MDLSLSTRQELARSFLSDLSGVSSFLLMIVTSAFGLPLMGLFSTGTLKTNNTYNQLGVEKDKNIWSPRMIEFL